MGFREKVLGIEGLSIDCIADGASGWVSIVSVSHSQLVCTRTE